ncbi:WASH complex subunit 7 [Papilio xuthus]|uniref:WASH complex subunit 7 n=1 Tax=Papilio xuthus TaxID=66420 RepID=A0A194PIW6_PAPXU|nr:WASH complex subunit 7 [Papilio xuthus]
MRSDTEKEAGAFILKNYGQFFKKQYQDHIQICGPTSLVENKTFLPIKIDMMPSEHIPIPELVVSDNTIMTKVLGVLSALCVEVSTLKKEAFERHFPFLAVYEEYQKSEIASQMESICLLNAFTSHCNDTLQNLCSQVFAIVSEGLINLNGIQLHYIINNIGELFTIIILLELLISRTSLPTKWNNYCKSLKTFAPENLDTYDEKFKAILGAIDNITAKIMSDDIVQNTLHNLLNLRKNNLIGKNCTTVTSEFSQYIKQALFNLEKLLQEKPTTENMYKCIKINSLFVLSSHLFGSSDKKIFKALVDLNTKAHSIHIIGTTLWFPEQFLQRYSPSLSSNHGKLSQTMLKARQAYMNAKKLSLSKDVATLQTISSQWTLNVEELFSNYIKLNAAEMNLHAKIILEGLEIASTIYHSLLTFLNLHLSLGIPLLKQTLMSLFEIIDILKSVKNAVTRNSNQIINSTTMIIQHLLFQTASTIQEVKKMLMCDKKYASKKLDELTCIVIAEQAVKGAATIERNTATNIALSFVPDTTYVDDTYIKLGTLLEKIQILTQFLNNMDKYCNCSWMLWHLNIIPVYFDQPFSCQLNALKLKNFFMVFEDCAGLLYRTDKYYDYTKIRDILNCATDIIEEKILNNMSQNIETNLRLHTHSHLQLDIVNPFTDDMIKKIFLIANNLRISNIYMNVVPNVEHYLSKTFYNLTTVVLSDWKTYGEMRQMAKLKFNLSTVQDNLPKQTLEQGLDILEIMRKIHIFVSKYHYNLNNQIFVEKSSNNKHLNSINIRHIANSIRTHGTGIMNTTVNFTYQFLKNKFFIFSQFMFDEQIKSRLIKDLRYFKENAHSSGNMYLYKHAEKFNKGIKMLGLAEDGQSYLDLFRDLITQIGNAMGYVRMVRSGGRHCCSDATAFLPSLDNKSFKQLCVENSLGDKATEAAENLDNNINDLVSNFVEGTEYFKLLVDVFAPVFRNPKNVHLKNFFIIVPPLTLNFVEHMILSKDKMSKKNKAGAAFTDDGFSVGVAYILKLLDQDANFESLHWFNSVWSHIKEEREIIDKQKNQGTLQLQQALALSEKKIKTLEEEFQLLYYSLTSARIFFR